MIRNKAIDNSVDVRRGSDIVKTLRPMVKTLKPVDL